jgi:thioredoxin-related protein
LVREIHQDPAVVRALNENFIPIRLEARSNLDLAQQYQVTRVPTTLLFSPQGEEIQRLSGFQPAGDYLKELAKSG